MGTFLILLGIYALYWLIVNFVIPVYKASKRVQEQFRNMQQNMNEHAHNGHGSTSANQKGSGTSKVNAKEYIDFEEIKD
jgi:hypothetical protein